MATEWVPRSEYGRKLQDPRWQKRRLEVMERDRFQCQACGDCRSMLNVHHIMYCPYERLDPWDYPAAMLVTLCAACHEAEPGYYRDALYLFVRALGRAGIRTSHELQVIAEIACNDDASADDEFESARNLADEIVDFRSRRDGAARLEGLWFFDL